MQTSVVETFRTDSITRSRRLTFWNDVAASTFGDISVEAASLNFTAQLTRVRLGGLTLAKVSSTPACVQGARRGTMSAPGCFLLLNERGDSWMRQGTREVHLGTGELTALRADERYNIEFSRCNTTLVLYVPHGTADFDLEPHVACRHACHEAPALIGLMRQLALLEEPAFLPGLDRLALDLLRLSWPLPTPIRRRTMQSWEQQVCRYVERHLSDPGLDAVAIARAHGVSARFMHMIFARLGCTAAAFILERRLASVSVSLGARPSVPIGRLALDAGFGDLSHFCRSFRRRFGMTARDYRRGVEGVR